MRKPAIYLATVSASLALAVGVAPAPAEVKPGQEQGLGLVGPETPDILKQIQADPYALPVKPGCDGVAEELAVLDRVLGPDADEGAKKASGSGVGGLVKSLIPYRGVLRFVTGAGKKEQQLTDAAIAGSARRGYLRGLQTSLNCNPAPAVAVADIPPPDILAPAAYTAQVRPVSR